MWSISHPHCSVFRALSAAWMPRNCLSGRQDSLTLVSPFPHGLDCPGDLAIRT
jgi:hypothetical protein